MSKKMTQKAIRAEQDVSVTDPNFNGFFESTEKIGHAEGIYGCNGWLRVGCVTGLNYGCAIRSGAMYQFDGGGAWDNAAPEKTRSALRYYDCNFYPGDDLGNREREILRDVCRACAYDNCTAEDVSLGHIVVRFKSPVTGKSFCFDFATREVCG